MFLNGILIGHPDRQPTVLDCTWALLINILKLPWLKKIIWVIKVLRRTVAQWPTVLLRTPISQMIFFNQGCYSWVQTIFLYTQIINELSHTCGLVVLSKAFSFGLAQYFASWLKRSIIDFARDEMKDILPKDHRITNSTGTCTRNTKSLLVVFCDDIQYKDLQALANRWPRIVFSASCRQVCFVSMRAH